MTVQKDDEFIPSNLSTVALDHKLKQLREEAKKHSQVLTQKLASSQSGQNLLHMGSSLSTLPPDVHSLLTQLHPLQTATEQTEDEQLQALKQLVAQAVAIREKQRRVLHAQECADAYVDLVAAERAVERDVQLRRNGRIIPHQVDEEKDSDDEDDDVDLVDEEDDDANHPYDDLDHAAALERAAHIALCLVTDLQDASQSISSLTTGKLTAATNDNGDAALPSLRTPLEEDTERAEFLLKLAPRIRRLESDTALCLCQRLEIVLRRWQEQQQQQQEQQLQLQQITPISDLLLMLGHCMRGLTLLGRGKDVESIFARVAIMPLIRSQVSMGRLDQGGARAECAGLPSLLEEITTRIATQFGPVLRLTEDMFAICGCSLLEEQDRRPVDLLTAGVWVPIATALLADAGIKMAIFSPGIASILQANYKALDSFLAQLAGRLLMSADDDDDVAATTAPEVPVLSQEQIRAAQDRIYAHAKTGEFAKKWNLPIYYQLRFGECCKRLNAAIDATKREGWVAEVFAGENAEGLKADFGFEISLFLELYDILLGLWKPDVILMPLTNRFLRGSIQMVGRTVEFIREGMDGTITFGEEKLGDNGEEQSKETLAMPVRNSYCWGDSEEDVAAVAWELAILESALQHDYVTTVCNAVKSGQKDLSTSESEELTSAIADVLKEASEQIRPVIDKAWNEKIVDILTSKCSAPLAAVKGVAATYRMTNRPPPTQASPFVATILRPLKEFTNEFANRTPESVGLRWKQQIVVTVADSYAAAVEELIATVQRTEVALQRQNARSRRTRLAAAGGMSDGEKVKLQLHLDYQTFSANVEEAGINPQTVLGLSQLQELTKEGEKLQQNQTGGG